MADTNQTRRIFLSSVTSEFGEHRALLKADLSLPRVKVQEQADFLQSGGKLLKTLDDYVRDHCDAVIHLVGGDLGLALRPDEVRWLLEMHASFAKRFPFLERNLQADPPELTYTQMEAWLALYYNKPCYLYRPSELEAHPLPDDHPQQIHWRRLEGLGEHYGTFDDPQHLCRRVLRVLHHLFPHEFPAPLARLIYPSLGELFIGREPFLADIRARLEWARANGRWPRHAVHGLGGVGKTRLAVEYAWRYRDHYAAVVMINAESQESLDRELATLAGVLDVNLDPHLSDPQRLQATRHWLQNNPGWLLLVDNVDTEPAQEAVAGRLQEWTAGHVVITGRIAYWPRDVEPLDLCLLNEKDAARFLMEATAGRREIKANDEEESYRLAADDLGGLCLALEQASSYISVLCISFESYRERWRKNENRVRQWAHKLLMRYHEDKAVSLSVATTWQTTIDQLQPAPRALLEMLSWLAPEPLPIGLIRHDKMQAELRKLVGDETVDIELALAELRCYSLVSRANDAKFGAAVQIHRLVQLFTRDQLTRAPLTATLTAMLAAIDNYTPTDSDDVRTWSVLEPLQPHLVAVIGHAEGVEIAEPTARLLSELGLLLYAKANYAKAEPLLRRALKFGERLEAEVEHSGASAVGEPGAWRRSTPVNHSNVATDLSNLAQLLQATNRLADAEPLMRRALALDEQSYGAEHPEVATDLNNLAQLLQATSRLADAETLMRRALALDEQFYGVEHPEVATDLNNLARLLQDKWYVLVAHAEQEEDEDALRTHAAVLTEAEPMYRRALAIDKQSYGDEHPNVARDLNNLALLLQDTNRLAEAESMMRTAWSIDEQYFGAKHPLVAIRLNNLALLLQDTNRLVDAELLMRHALAIDEQSFGMEHPKVARDLYNLAGMLRDTNQTKEAKSLMQRAAKIARATMPEEHPWMFLFEEDYRSLLETMR